MVHLLLSLLDGGESTHINVNQYSCGFETFSYYYLPHVQLANLANICYMCYVMYKEHRLTSSFLMMMVMSIRVSM